MCGIVGYITEEVKNGSSERVRFMRQGLIIDTLRGEDSTGVFSVPHANKDKNGDYNYHTAYWTKSLGDGYNFVNTENYGELMENEQLLKYVVGHNRAATQGAVNVDNAHPFQEGPITMVHNGTLVCDLDMPKTMADLNVSVDSHAICHNLALQPNTKEGVQEVIRTLNGAFTLIWHDARDDTLNIVRNDERPLHFMQSKWDNTIYFASEAEMLNLLAARIKMTVYPELHFPEAGCYMKFHQDDVLNPEIHTLELYEAFWGNSANYWAKYEEDYYRQWEQKNKAIDYNKRLPRSRKDENPEVLDEDGEGVYLGRDNCMVNSDTWLHQTHSGCMTCGLLPGLEQGWEIVWRGAEFECNTCAAYSDYEVSQLGNE